MGTILDTLTTLLKARMNNPNQYLDNCLAFDMVTNRLTPRFRKGTKG